MQREFKYFHEQIPLETTANLTRTKQKMNLTGVVDIRRKESVAMSVGLVLEIIVTRMWVSMYSSCSLTLSFNLKIYFEFLQTVEFAFLQM